MRASARAGRADRLPSLVSLVPGALWLLLLGPLGSFLFPLGSLVWWRRVLVTNSSCLRAAFGDFVLLDDAPATRPAPNRRGVGLPEMEILAHPRKTAMTECTINQR